jgi:hypothetical protein
MQDVNWKNMPQDKPRKIRLDPGIIEGLNSDKENTVLRTIQTLRNTGSIHYIPEILRVLSSSDNENIEKELVRFLADIKDPGAIPFIIRGLKDKDLRNARAPIISACWQSSLDYRNELPLFVKIFLEEDYTTAIECFSVIEEAAMEMESESVADVRELVMDGLDQVSEDKKPLARELIRSLET